MVSSVLGIINLGEREDHIKELTERRPLAAVPFAGRYRMIDFMLSNMVNSGIDTLSIVLKDKFHSLNDHIGPGKAWDLDRRTGGLRLLYPDVDRDPTKLNLGDIPIMADNLNYFKRTRKDHVLLVRSNYLGNIDFQPAIRYHQENDNDITLLTRHIINGRHRVDLLGLDLAVREGNSISIGRNLGNNDVYDLSVEMYILKREVFIEIITEAIETGNEAFLKRAILDRLKNYHVDIYTIPVDILPIHSIQDYFNASMQLLDPEYAQYFFYENGKIYTKVKDAPSSIYLGETDVNNSLIANGCVIEGTVENSVIFRNVKVGAGAVIRNSIIFQDAVIGNGCNINNCIIDKNVVIGKDRVLIGDGGIPYVIKKGVSIK